MSWSREMHPLSEKSSIWSTALAFKFLNGLKDKSIRICSDVDASSKGVGINVLSIS